MVVELRTNPATQALAIMILVLVLPVRAEQASGVIAGIARDIGGSAMPGVTVTATSNGKHSTAVTNSSGQYSIVGLERGTYLVTGVLAGFRTVTCEGVNVTAAVAHCDLILQIGGPPIQRADARYQALEAAETRWRMAGIRSYEYGASVACFCGFDRTPFAIRVVEGIPSPLTGNDRWRNRAGETYNTIEKLFGMVRGAFERGYEVVDVTYDDSTGRPIRISIDMSKHGEDDDVVITVSGFRPIK